MAEEKRFTRAHFPLVRRYILPPYHPSMAIGGINFNLMPELLDDVVEETIRDLEENRHVRNFPRILEKAREEKKKRWSVRRTDSDGVRFADVPIVTHLFVGRSCINASYGIEADGGIAFGRHLQTDDYFMVPKEVVFSDWLMKEYQMTPEKDQYVPGWKLIASPNLWYGHNVIPLNGIFFRNVIVALDNEAARRV